MKIAQLGSFLAGREIQINKKERVVSDPPKSVVGNSSVPVLLRTLPDASVQHAERRLELARENCLDVFNHGNHSTSGSVVESSAERSAKLPGRRGELWVRRMSTCPRRL